MEYFIADTEYDDNGRCCYLKVLANFFSWDGTHWCMN